MKTPDTKPNLFRRVVSFYVDGFRSMTLGKSLWVLIIVKVFILFAVLKLFLFPDVLSERFGDDDAAKAAGVRQTLISNPASETENINYSKNIKP